MSIWNPTKNLRWTLMIRGCKQLLPHYVNLSLCFFRISDGKSWIRKGQMCEYDKGNISVVICNTYIPKQFTKSWLPPKNLWNEDFNITTGNHWFSSCLISNKSLSRKSWFWRTWYPSRRNIAVSLITICCPC